MQLVIPANPVEGTPANATTPDAEARNLTRKRGMSVEQANTIAMKLAEKDG